MRTWLGKAPARGTTRLNILECERREMPAVGGGFAGGGIEGSYYANSNYAGTPSYLRTDVRLDFDWGWNSPGGSTSPDYQAVGRGDAAFTVKWNGVLLPRFGETYTLRATTEADDSFRLFLRGIDSNNLPGDYDSWNPGDGESVPFQRVGGTGSKVDWQGTYSFQAGQRYQIRIRYRDPSGAAAMQLKWSSASTPLETIETATGVGLNVAPALYYDQNYFLADALKTARWWWAPTNNLYLNLDAPGAANRFAVATDANGWPATDAGIVLFDNLSEMDGTYEVTFRGKARVNVAGTKYAGAQSIRILSINDAFLGSDSKPADAGYDPATNTTRFKLVVHEMLGQGRTNLALVFSDTQRTASSGRNTGFTNLSVMRPTEADPNVAYAPGTNFTDAYKDALSGYSVLRTMAGTNSNQSTSWNTRTQPTYWNQFGTVDLAYRPFSANDAPERSEGRGMSWEHRVLLANETGKDLYITIPAKADDDYVRKLAQLLRYGSKAETVNGALVYRPANPGETPDYPPLNSNLRVYVEYSNEIWNTAYPYSQSLEIRKAAKDAVNAYKANPNSTSAQARLGKALYFDRVEDEFTWARRYQAHRTAVISNIFRNVTGDAAMGDRVRVLLMGQYANENRTMMDTLFYLDKLSEADPATFGAAKPVKYYLWGAGAATYFKGSNEFGITDIVKGSDFSSPNAGTNTTWTNPPGIPGFSFSGSAGIRDANNVQSAFVDAGGRVRLSVQLPWDQQSPVYAVTFKAARTAGNVNGVEVVVDGRRVTNNGYSGNVAGAITLNEWFGTYYTLTFQGAPGSWHTIDFTSTNSTGRVLLDDIQLQSVDALFKAPAQSPSPFPDVDAGYQQSFEAFQRRTNVEANWARAFGLEFVGYEGGWAFGADSAGAYGRYTVLDYAKYDIAPSDPRYDDVIDLQKRSRDTFTRAGGALEILGTYSQWRGNANAGRDPLPAALESTLARLPAEPSGNPDANDAVHAPNTLTRGNAALGSGIYYGIAGPSQMREFNGERSNPYNARVGDMADWMTWNVYAPSTGTYRLTAATSDLGGGRFRILLDDESTGIEGLAGDDASGTVYLTKGVHTIRLKAVAGRFGLEGITIGAPTGGGSPGGGNTGGGSTGGTTSNFGEEPVYLSDLNPTSSRNGWGPVEKDRSNGENLAGDGGRLTLNGRGYDKGLGVHEGSSITYTIPAGANRFRADIGIDDEVGNGGSVVFNVYFDGSSTPAYTSGGMWGASATKTIDLAVAGRRTIRLEVTDNGDGTAFDHANWADARFTPRDAVQLSDINPVYARNGLGPVERNRSNGEAAAGDGRTMSINGRNYATGLGVSEGSVLVYDVPTGATRFRSDVGVDDEVGNAGSVSFEVHVPDNAGVEIPGAPGRWRRVAFTPVMTGADDSRSMDVALGGASRILLAVHHAGDGPAFDHADWGIARFLMG